MCAPLECVVVKLNDAYNAGDWRGALLLEGRMEALVARQSDDVY